jgi:hypothetical protein
VNVHHDDEARKIKNGEMSPLPGAPNVEVVLRHFHRCRYWSSTPVVLLLERLRSLRSWLSRNTVDTKIYVVQATGA